MPEYLDMQITWLEFGNVYARLAEDGRQSGAVRGMRADLDKAMAAAAALHEMAPTLSDEQRAVVQRVAAQQAAMRRG